MAIEIRQKIIFFLNENCRFFFGDFPSDHTRNLSLGNFELHEINLQSKPRFFFLFYVYKIQNSPTKRDEHFILNKCVEQNSQMQR